MSDDEKALFLTIALASFETVRNAENPKSSRRNKLDKAMDKIVDLTDIYRLEAWPAEKISAACEVLDSLSERIKEMFGDTTTERSNA